MPGPRRLVDWPWVLIEVECSLCRRHGRYRLARLAEKLGAERDLGELLLIIGARCTLPKHDETLRRYEARCGARYRVPSGGPLPAVRRPEGARAAVLADDTGADGQGRDAPAAHPKRDARAERAGDGIAAAAAGAMNE